MSSSRRTTEMMGGGELRRKRTFAQFRDDHEDEPSGSKAQKSPAFSHRYERSQRKSHRLNLTQQEQLDEPRVSIGRSSHAQKVPKERQESLRSSRALKQPVQREQTEKSLNRAKLDKTGYMTEAQQNKKSSRKAVAANDSGSESDVHSRQKQQRKPNARKEVELKHSKRTLNQKAGQNLSASVSKAKINLDRQNDQTMSLRAPKSEDSEFFAQVINHKKLLANMDDKELLLLADKYARVRLCDTDGKSGPMPDICRLSKIKGTSSIDDMGARCLEVQQMTFERREHSSDIFEKNCVINYQHVTKKRKKCQFRPLTDQKFWLVKSIVFKFLQVGTAKISVHCEISLIKVVRTITLLKTQPQLVVKVLSTLAKFSKMSEKEVSSKESCMLAIEKSSQGYVLSLDSFIYDWNRIYRVKCCQKVSQVQVEKQTDPDPYRTIIALKYAYMVMDDGNVQLFDLKNVTLAGKWGGVLLPIQETEAEKSEEGEVPVHTVQTSRSRKAVAAQKMQKNQNVTQVPTATGTRGRTQRTKPKLEDQSFFTEVEEDTRKRRPTQAAKRPKKKENLITSASKEPVLRQSMAVSLTRRQRRSYEVSLNNVAVDLQQKTSESESSRPASPRDASLENHGSELRLSSRVSKPQQNKSSSQDTQIGIAARRDTQSNIVTTGHEYKGRLPKMQDELLEQIKIRKAPDAGKEYESDGLSSDAYRVLQQKRRAIRRKTPNDSDSQSNVKPQTKLQSKKQPAAAANTGKRNSRKVSSDNQSQGSSDSSQKSRPKRQAIRSKMTKNRHNSTILEVPDEQMASAKSSSALSEAVITDSNHSDPDADRFQIHKSLQKGRLSEKEFPYDAACSKLQLSTIPDHLPCRDEERQMIVDYVKHGLKNKGSSSSLYISGMPGTGKTATTMEVIRNMKTKYKFSFLAINAMQLTNPNLVYTIIYEKITGKKVAPANAALFLDEFFKKRDKVKVLSSHLNQGVSSKKNKVTQTQIKEQAQIMRVVLIDELDALMTTKQTLLYNLFDWPCHQNSRLLVISIANTMDLPERMQKKISSRIGNNRLVYQPYTLAQIHIILKERLMDIETIIDQKGLDFIARKVSMYSGDIRRSLQITKRAVELARDEWESKLKKDPTCKLIPVAFRHALEAFNDLFNSKTVRVLKSLMHYEMMVVIALHLELKSHGAERVLLDRVHHKANYLFGSQQMSGLSSATFREIVKRLQAFGLLNLQIENRIIDNCFLQLNVFDDELVTGFLDNKEAVKIAQSSEHLREAFENQMEAREMTN